MCSPGIFIHLDRHQCVLHGLVDKCVYAGHKEVDGAEKRFAILAEQFLCLCIVAKLILKKVKNIIINQNFRSYEVEPNFLFNTLQAFHYFAFCLFMKYASQVAQKSEKKKHILSSHPKFW